MIHAGDFHSFILYSSIVTRPVRKAHVGLESVDDHALVSKTLLSVQTVREVNDSGAHPVFVKYVAGTSDEFIRFSPLSSKKESETE